jgi:hypothetical protein
MNILYSDSGYIARFVDAEEYAKQEAVEFAEWTNINSWVCVMKGKWVYAKPDLDDSLNLPYEDGEEKTTIELFTLYKEGK